MLYFGRGPTLFPSYDTSDLLQHWTYDSCWSDVHSIFLIRSVRWGQVIGFDNFCLVLRIDRLGALRLLNNFASDLWNVCIFPYICHLTYKCVHLTYKSFASDLKKLCIRPILRLFIWTTNVVHPTYKRSARNLQLSVKQSYSRSDTLTFFSIISVYPTYRYHSDQQQPEVAEKPRANRSEIS